MADRLTMEERAQREADARFANDALSELQQFAKLRATYPDLDDKELAHRMTLSVPAIRKLKKLLEK